MSPETQRRIDRSAPFAWSSRYNPGTFRWDDPSERPIADRRIVCPPVLSEALFKGALIRERKRMDRSNRSFALLLISVDERPGEDPLLIWGSIVEALAAAKRQTDVLGWFERGSVIGVALTEIASRDAAVMSGLEGRFRKEIAKQLNENTASSIWIQLYAHPDLTVALEQEVASEDPVLRRLHPRERRGQAYRMVKRGLDIAGSLALLLILSPAFLLLAALVKCSSRGPVFFRQDRVGEMAKPFTMLKFRTMFTGADHALHQEFVTRFITSRGVTQQPVKDAPFKIADDPRITPLGRILRKTSLDELPQLWNVLRGEMSLVGPRPPLGYEVERYKRWHCRRILEAKPGITGLWQVNGRSRTTFDEMVRLDLRYAKCRSLWTDIRILLATPAAVVSGKGAA